MTSVLGFIRRNYLTVNPPSPPKNSDALKFGILGAANIGNMALFLPARSHPDVIIHAVAARNKSKADVYAKKYGIPHVFGSYQELLDSPDIDVIYNPLPNGLHYEWTMKALLAGKHVLLEKPSANRSAETAAMFALAKEKNLVLLEAFHYQFHPAIHRVKAILDSGELGKITSTNAIMKMPQGLIKAGDIRFDHGLGGGGLMDMGCYALSVTRYLAGDPTEVLSADTIVDRHFTDSDLVDRGATAHLVLGHDGTTTAKITCDMSVAPAYGFVPRMPDLVIEAVCEHGSIKLSNFVAATHFHNITITKGKDGRIEKVYKPADGKGDVWWTTYRYQLESFVDRLRGRTPAHWVTEEHSVGNMHWIEEIYKKNGLDVRPASSFVYP